MVLADGPTRALEPEEARLDLPAIFSAREACKGVSRVQRVSTGLFLYARTSPPASRNIRCSSTTVEASARLAAFVRLSSL